MITSADEQPTFRSASMPGNYQFLTITNSNGVDGDGFPAFYGNGPQQIAFHLDLSGQDIISSTVPFTVQVLTSDWDKTVYTQNYTYSSPADFNAYIPSLDYGAYVLVVYMGSRPLYWQVFSVDSQTAQALGSAVIALGIVLAIAALYPEKMGRYH